MFNEIIFFAHRLWDVFNIKRLKIISTHIYCGLCI